MDEQEKHKAESKIRLSNSIKRKITTTMIGALSEFETEFGHLWGLDKADKTAEELKFENLWHEVRGHILDKGNKQISLMNQELRDYDIDWNSLTITFTIGKKDKE